MRLWAAAGCATFWSLSAKGLVALAADDAQASLAEVKPRLLRQASLALPFPTSSQKSHPVNQDALDESALGLPQVSAAFAHVVAESAPKPAQSVPKGAEAALSVSQEKVSHPWGRCGELTQHLFRSEEASLRVAILLADLCVRRLPPLLRRSLSLTECLTAFAVDLVIEQLNFAA